ncbi:MAG: hypothetical protein LBE62_05210 [Azonexus sp.]|jgi:hypothetical protein|nr:hypothetical protein [Azonexus sp.]
MTQDQSPFACLALAAMLGILVVNAPVLDKLSKVTAANAAQLRESLADLLPAPPSTLPHRPYRPL